MDTRQLHLFELPRPLIDRLGDDFFRSAPRAAGIYIMVGQNDRILYIGQSSNLRARLASYKNARPDRASSKVVRLVRQVRSISWEICDDPAAAQLRENELLRLHRPKFNVQNTYPRGYTFLWLMETAQTLEIGRLQDPDSLPAGLTLPSPALRQYGAFKTHVVTAYGALLRLLWTVLNEQCRSPEFPLRLLSPKPPRHYSLKFSRSSSTGQLLELLDQFLLGGSDALLNWLEETLPKSESLLPFYRMLQTIDLELLVAFYRFGSRRNFEYRTIHNLSTSLIPKESLDDFRVFARSSVNEKK